MSKGERASDSSERPKQWKYGVDLDALRAAEQAGDYVDVLGEYDRTVKRDEIIYQVINDQGSARSDNADARRAARRAIGGGRFLEVFGETVANSENLGQYEWFLTKLILPINLNHEVPGFDVSGDKFKRYRTITKTRLFGLAVKQIYEFCEKNPNPDDMTAAVEIWESTLTAAYGDEFLDHNVNNNIGRIYVAQLSARSRIPMAQHQRTKDRTVYNALQQRATWGKGLINVYKGEGRADKLISVIEDVPIPQIEIKMLDILNQFLLEGGTVPRKKPGDLIARSIVATRNITRSLVEYLPDPQAVASANLISMTLDKKQRTAEAPVAASEVISLANSRIIANRLSEVLGVELDKLDPATIEDFPKAIDRILQFTLDAQAIQAIGDPEVAQKFRLAAECAQLLAFNAVSEKLAQRVLTVGDLVARYSVSLPPEAVRAIIENRQRSRSETEFDRLYRELRLLSKNQAFFRMNSTGRGMLK